MSRRIRVVQLVSGLAVGEYNGGGEVFAMRLAQFLDPEQFEVAVCALWAYDSRIERDWQRTLVAQGIPTYFGTHYRADLRLDLEMAFVTSYRLLRRLRPDILNTHTEYPDIVGLAIKLAGGARTLVRTCHNVVEWPFAPHRARQLARLYPLICKYQVGVSRAVVDILDQHPVARLLHKRAVYIPNAIEPELVLAQRTDRDMRAVLGVPRDAPLFGIVGRLSDQKGMPYLIEAMRGIRAALPEARLLIVGNGEKAAELRELVSELGLDGCIRFLGPRTDAIDIIAGLDVLVSSSLWEGLPTVILEAMLLGTPVIATDIAGSRDLVIEGKTGLLVPPRDSAALARAAIRQYVERAQAQAMAATARRHVEQFTIRAVARAYGALYTDLCGRRNNGART
jgi:glycosyltransferase involved in cell wall biosynthesis